jgi:polysaccharide biosynthesis protein PslH
MKKTLIVCGAYPQPENTGSNIRTMNFVRFFKEYGAVDLAYTRGTKVAENKGEMFRKELPLIRLDDSRPFGGRVRMALRGSPYPIGQYGPASKESIVSEIEHNNYEWILVRHVVNSNWIFNLSSRDRPKIILDMDDVMSESVYETFFDSSTRIDKRLLRALNRSLLRHYERRCTGFGATIFCSRTDLSRMERHLRKQNAFVVPNIFSSEDFAKHDFGDGFTNPNIFLFVGSLFYDPNAEGLNWFVNEIYPDVRKKYSDAKLLVVGRSPNDRVTLLQKMWANTEVRTNVMDLKPFYEGCRAVIVPILAGGGTRIKILEAALAHRPILSTPMGAEGLEMKDGAHLYLFESSREFLDKYGRLADAPTYRAMVEESKDLVLNKYSRRNFNEAMIRVITHVDNSCF